MVIWWFSLILYNGGFAVWDTQLSVDDVLNFQLSHQA